MAATQRSTRSMQTRPAKYRDTGIPSLRGNIFADALGPVPSLDMLRKIATQEPARPTGLTVLSPSTAQAILQKEVYDQLFIPGEQHLEVIEQLHIWMRMGYEGRDVRKPSFVSKIYEGVFEQTNAPGHMMLVSGIAGGGKTALLKAFARTLPQGLIEHDVQVPGLGVPLQLPALVLRMQSSQSRSQLFENLLGLLSYLIGFDFPKIKNGSAPSLSALQGPIRNALLLNSCGLVIGDEFQWLKNSRFGGVAGLKDFLLMLRAMGIPTVVACNYDVVEAVCDALNLTRRFGQNFFAINPMSSSSADWKKLVSKVFGYYPHGLDAAFLQAAPAAVFHFSAGNPDLLCKLALASYKIPLREERRLKIDDLTAGYWSSEFSIHRGPVNALITQNPKALKKHRNLVPAHEIELPADVLHAYAKARGAKSADAYRNALEGSKGAPLARQYRPSEPGRQARLKPEPNDLRNAGKAGRPGDLYAQAGTRPRSRS